MRTFLILAALVAAAGCSRGPDEAALKTVLEKLKQAA